MISGDRSILQGKKGAFWYTLEEFSKHWERIDVVCPRNAEVVRDKRLVVSENVTAHYPLPTTHSPFPNVFFHPSPGSLWTQIRWIVKKGRELIAEHHHDVITAHEYPPFYNGIGARHLHQATAVPYVLEVHHIVGLPKAASFMEWLGALASRWQIPRNASRAMAVRTVNENVRDTLVLWNIPYQKIHVVPSFYLDTEKLEPNPSIQQQYDVVFCGRLVANKGLPEVLRAVAALPGVTLLIIGDGPKRQSMEAQAKSLGISDRVTFRGWLSFQEDVIAAMQSAKIFVMHSSSEGGPRSALEAMALGMPVIVTRVGVMPDVIEDEVNGVFTDGTAEGLQGEIRMLLEDQAMRERIGKEAQRITERFERKKLIKEYADFLKSLMSAESTCSPLTNESSMT